MMSPKTCDWMSSLSRLITLIVVVQLVAQELHAERAVDLRVGLGRAGEARVEHVLEERIVHVAHRQVAEEAALAEVEADVEAVGRRQVDLRDVEVRLGLGLDTSSSQTRSAPG